MWVSRLNIPLYAGREDIPFNFNLTLKTADQLCAVGVKGNKLGNRFPVLGNDNAVGSDPIQ